MRSAMRERLRVLRRQAYLAGLRELTQPGPIKPHPARASGTARYLRSVRLSLATGTLQPLNQALTI